MAPVAQASSFSNGQAASLVIGQSSFTTSLAATTSGGLNGPRFPTFDSAGNLWVSDEANNRVLEYTAPFSTGESTSLVLGQSSLVTSSSALSASGLSDPRGLAFDSSGNLWVADSNNNRVLEYAAPFTTGEAATLVLGQSSFTINASATTATGEYAPTGLAFDTHGNLWVTDTGNQRTLEYTTPFTTGEAASLVLGQSSFTTGTSATSATGEFVPGGLAFDATGNLWVADGRNNRVIEYVAPFVTGEAASLVLGQSSFTSNTFATSATGEGNPGAVAFDSSGNLWVVDTTNSRVLEYSAPFSTDEAASLVLGQSSFTTSTTVTTASGLMYPEGLAFDSGGNLWVTDNYNNRVLEYAPSSGSTATTSTSSSTSSATSTVLTTTTLTSCTGNSAGNGIFGVCVEPSSIDQGGTVAVTGYAFGSGSTYVLNVTEPDGARFGTEFYSYSCSTAPCSTSATFPTDFTFQILGTFQTASTSQPGTYYASTCAYSAPRDCATTTFTVLSPTTTTTTTSSASTTTTSTTASTATAPLTDQVQASDSVGAPPSPLSELLHVVDSLPAPPPPLSDTVGVADSFTGGVAKLVTATLNDAVSAVDTMGQAGQTTLTDVISAVDQIGKSANAMLTDMMTALDGAKSVVTLPTLTFNFASSAPVNGLITDSQGRVVGCNSNGVFVEQPPGWATVTFPGPPGTGCDSKHMLVTIPNAVVGNYVINVYGTAQSSTKGSHFTLVTSAYSLSGSLLYSLPVAGELTPTDTETIYITVLSNGQIVLTQVMSGAMAASSLALSALALSGLDKIRPKAKGNGRRPALLRRLLWRQ